MIQRQHQRTHLHRQAGMSFGGWFMVILVVLSLATVATRMVPAYVDHSTIDKLISDQLNEPKVGDLSNAKFLEKLRENLKRNNIRDMNLKDMLTIERGNGTIKIHLAYEVREHLFSNVDVVMSFANDYEKITN